MGIYLHTGSGPRAQLFQAGREHAGYSLHEGHYHGMHGAKGQDKETQTPAQ